MPVAESGGVFVSYRREDSSHLAGRLYDRLVDRFGEGQIFMDVDTIGPGADVAEEISRALAACAVLVAVIGRNCPSQYRSVQARWCRLRVSPDHRGDHLIRRLCRSCKQPGRSVAGLPR